MESATLRLANWNVMLPVSERRRAAVLAHLDAVGADVCVLTETHDGLALPYAYSHSSDAGRDGGHQEGHRWVTVWSNSRLQPLTVSDSQRCTAVRVFPDDDAPYVVFGTVLPWLGSTWRGRPSAGGVAFREALELQADDWGRMSRDYPDDEFFVIGDFNQELVVPRYYGSRMNRAALESALGRVGLVAMTGEANDPIRRESPPCACIDHICGRADSRWRLEGTRRWPDTAAPIRSLSDHFGVAVELARSA